jgi:glycogen debranching enzyme
MLKEKLQKAVEIINRNDRGGFTIPSNKLYPHQWNWDSAFTALGIFTYNKTRAWQELILLINSQWTNGMIPHIVFHENNPNYFPGPHHWQIKKNSKTSCHSQPPVLASIILEMVRNGDDYDLKKSQSLFNSLMAYHDWFFSARDPNNEGFMSIIHPWESGRDNCPDWDLGLEKVEIPDDFDEYLRCDTSHVEISQRPTNEDYDKFMSIVQYGKNCDWDTLEMYNYGPFLAIDPGINFIFLKANKDLLSLAKLLNYKDKIHKIEDWINRLEKGCQKFWNDEVKAFTAFDIRTNQFSDAITNASMLCLYADAGTDKQKKYTIEHCKRFLDDCVYGMPSLDPKHESFESKRYWRGPVWFIMNYMILVGLENEKEYLLAKRIRDDTIKLTDVSGMFEYFDPITGKGLGGNNFSWTAAIFLKLCRETFDFQLFNN